MYFFQRCQQVFAKGGAVLGPDGKLRKSDRDLRTSIYFIHFVLCLITSYSLVIVRYVYPSLQVAADAIESSLLKYSAKEYFFKASLCQMCIDALEARRAVDKYCDMYAAFQDTRECKLLRVILVCCSSCCEQFLVRLDEKILNIFEFSGITRRTRRGKCRSVHRSGMHACRESNIRDQSKLTSMTIL